MVWTDGFSVDFLVMGIAPLFLCRTGVVMAEAIDWVCEKLPLFFLWPAVLEAV